MDVCKYTCKKCQSEHVVVKQAGGKTGLYCGKCGAWIQWLTDKELKAIYQKIKAENNGNGKVFRRFIKRKDGSTIIKCSGCNCQLFNSIAPEPIGQFNLVDAKYCPKCGSELY